MTLEHVKSEVITCIVDDCLWPNADNTGHVINAAVLLFQCKSIVAVSAIREWRTLPHLPRDRGR
mgnify:CR=1 FL=1